MPYKVLIPQDISDMGKDYLRERGYEVVVGTGIQLNYDELGQYDAILLRTAIIDKKAIDAATKLKVIGRYGVGLDNIDVDYCKQKGIVITYAPHGNTVSVMEHTMMLILQCAKNVNTVNKLFRCDTPNFNSRNTHCGIELDGKTLGIIGLGNIGKRVAKAAAFGFNMNVVSYDKYILPGDVPEGVKLVSKEEVLQQSDFVTLHVPLNEETKNMITLKELKMMKRSAFLIDAARGSVVNEADLVKALDENIIAGAGIDVFETEPVVSHLSFFKMDNVYTTPHIAGMTKESSDRVGLHAAMGIDEVLSGKRPSWPIPDISSKHILG